MRVEQEVGMFNIGPWELGLILLVALIVVGPGKLPEVAKAIGKGISEFKKVTNGYKREFQEAMQDIEKQASLEKSTAADNSGSVVQPAQSVDALAKQFDTSMEQQSEESIAAHKGSESVSSG